MTTLISVLCFEHHDIKEAFTPREEKTFLPHREASVNVSEGEN